MTVPDPPYIYGVGYVVQIDLGTILVISQVPILSLGTSSPS